MNNRTEIESKFFINGKPTIIKLINNPLIDDIVIAEARVQATSIERGTIDPNRRVSRDLRNFFIKLGIQ